MEEAQLWRQTQTATALSMALRRAEGWLRAPAAGTFLILSVENLPPQTNGRSPQAAIFDSVLYCSPRNRPRTLSNLFFLGWRGGGPHSSFHHFFAAVAEDSFRRTPSLLPQYGCIENTGTGTSLAVELFQTWGEEAGWRGSLPAINLDRETRRGGDCFKNGRKVLLTQQILTEHFVCEALFYTLGIDQ